MLLDKNRKNRMRSRRSIIHKRRRRGPMISTSLQECQHLIRTGDGFLGHVADGNRAIFFLADCYELLFVSEGKV